jgi:hypothetical protein
MKLNLFTSLDVSNISYLWRCVENYLNVGGPKLKVSETTSQTLSLEPIENSQTRVWTALKVGAHAFFPISFALPFRRSPSLHTALRLSSLVLYTITVFAFVIRTYFRQAYNFKEFQKPPSGLGDLSKKIKWLTGSKSSALPIMFSMKAPPALMPISQLLRQNLAPLSGEISWVSTCLSGVQWDARELAVTYAKRTHFEFNADVSLTKIEEELKKVTPDIAFARIHLLRLQLTGSLKQPSIQTRLQKIISVASQEKFYLSLNEEWEKFVGCIGKEYQVKNTNAFLRGNDYTLLKRGEIVAVKVNSKSSLGMVDDFNSATFEVLAIVDIATGSQPFSKTSIFKLSEQEYQDLEKNLPEASDEQKRVVKEILLQQSRKELLQQFQKLVRQEVQVISQEMMTTYVEKPFPIVWGSETLQGSEPRGVAGKPGERNIAEICALGEKIQYAFTEQQHIPTLKKSLGSINVQVLDISLLDPYGKVSKIREGVFGSTIKYQGEEIYLRMEQLTAENAGAWEHYRKAVALDYMDQARGILRQLVKTAGTLNYPTFETKQKTYRYGTNTIASLTGFSQEEYTAFSDKLLSLKEKIAASIEGIGGGVAGLETCWNDVCESFDPQKASRYIIYATKNRDFSIPITPSTNLKSFFKDYQDLLICMGSNFSQPESFENRGIFRNPYWIIEQKYAGLSMLLHGFAGAVATDFFKDKQQMLVKPIGSMQVIIKKALKAGEGYVIVNGQRQDITGLDVRADDPEGEVNQIQIDALRRIYNNFVSSSE